MDKQKDIIEKKKEIRKEIIRRLVDQSPELREERSRNIIDKLLLSEEFKVASTVMTYVSLPTEVSTEYLNQEALKQGKKVAVPYIEPETNELIASEITTIECLKKGPLGIYQPTEDLVKRIPLEEIDLIIVPAIAYDANNLRLGRGKGYYDRFLSEGSLASVKTVGLAFNFQIVDSLPITSHDIPVGKVITD